MRGFLQEINGEPLLGGLRLLIIGDSVRSVSKLGVDATLARPVKKSDLYRALCRLMDVQTEPAQSPQLAAEKLTNQFLYADSQGQSWAETVPIETIAEAEVESTSEVRLMGHVLLVEDNLVNLNVAKKSC